MIDTRVTSMSTIYKQRISAKLYCTSTTYCGVTLGAFGVPNNLFIALLCSDHVLGVQFFKVLLLNRSSTV
jgi:hypothetical protein